MTAPEIVTLCASIVAVVLTLGSLRVSRRTSRTVSDAVAAIEASRAEPTGADLTRPPLPTYPGTGCIHFVHTGDGQRRCTRSAEHGGPHYASDGWAW